MFLKVIGPVGYVEELAVDSRGLSLGALFTKTQVDSVRINGRQEDEWRDYIPQQGDRIEVEGSTADFGIISGPIIATTLGVTLGTATTIATVVSSLVLSMALSQIVRALTPKPKKPKLDSNPEQAFGIGGFTNTQGRGTPAFVPYGANRLWGHVISSGAVLSSDGKQMNGRILYFMGDTGGDGLDGIHEILLDGTGIDQYPEITVHTRIGTDPQPVIPEFENQDSLFSDGRSLAFNTGTGVGTPIVYTTRGNNINRATLFIAFPGGLYRVGDKGKQHSGGVNHLVELRDVTNSGSFFTYGTAMWHDQTTTGTFKAYEINFPIASQWDIRITTIEWVGFDPSPDQAYIADSVLFNVQETVFTTKTYPGWALLGLTGIPAKRIRSLESLNVSAKVYGKRVMIPTGPGTGVLQYTRQRCWIVRDMMTHPIVGMGSEIDSSEIDNSASLAAWYEAQNYYDELVTGHAGLEARDLCDVIVGDSDWDWEWVKKVAGEARGRIIPSGAGWKYVIDKPGIPNLLYTEGANIVDGSISQEIAPPDKPFTEISAEFRDEDKDYERNFSPPIRDPEAISTVQELQRFETITRESEVQRENRIVFKRNFLERRRWQFLSPMGAIVSEPMDLDYFGERGIGGEGAYGGILAAGSSTTVINLPFVATLQAATYALIVKHRLDNTTEYRTVATGLGDWGQVTVTAPFIQAPDEGDAFSLGIQDVEHIVTRAQDLEIDGEGRVKQVRTEYIPAVYTEEALPPKSARRFFNLQDRRPPIPLRDAQIREEVAMNRDGSVRSILIFDVTPGLPNESGLVDNGSNLGAVVLAFSSPDRDDYYNGAVITLTTGGAAGQESKISGYVGGFRAASLATPLTVIPAVGDTYLIQWQRFSDFGGFRVGMSEDAVNFSDMAKVNGTHWEMDGRGAGPGTVYFRFTPFSANGVENTVARIVVGIVIVGDLSAPVQPLAVEVSAYLLTVRVVVYLQKPVAEDFAGVEIEIWRDAIGSVGLEATRFGAPSDSATSGLGTMRIEATFNLGARFPPEVAGTTIIARARSVDFSQNYSFFTNGNSTVLTGEINPGATGAGPPAVPTGLTLTTGSQVDPFDGVIKPFLNIAWNANTESDIASYEVHYRQQSEALVGVVARVVSHPQLSIREIGLVGGIVYQVRIQAIDQGGLRSGFTDWNAANGQITIAHDVTPPPPPTILNILGGFEMISIYFAAPSVPDFAYVEAFIAPANDFNQVNRVERSAPDSISIRVASVNTQGLDAFTWFVWIRAVDTSGNVSAMNNPFGTAVQVRRISGGDVVQFSAIITQHAQIQDAIIDNAHIQNLAVDKVLAGHINVVFRIGAGLYVYIDGLNRLIGIHDETLQPRVLLGRLGPSIQDYGLNIFGADGSLWHSFTGGTQSKGRQDQNLTSFSVALSGTGTGATWITGVMIISNTANVITARVSALGRDDVKGGATARVTYQDHTVTHNAGKIMAATPCLTSITEGAGGGNATATLQIFYW